MATLLRHGADITIRSYPILSRGFVYSTPNALDLAIQHCPELIEPLLLKAITLSLDKQNSFLASVDRGVYPSVLLYAAERHPLLLDALIAELKKQPQEIIESTLRLKNNEGKTVLMRAAGLGRIEAARNLIDMGANIEAIDDGRNTAMHEAARYGHANIIELLVENTSLDKKAALMEFKNEKGETPLHLAARIGGRVVTVLLEQGADLNARNHQGKNALDIAIRSPEVMKQLLLKVIKLSPDEQKACLSNIAGGIYENVLVYAMCEQPECVDDLLIAMGKKEQYLAGYQEMQKFFDIDVHLDTFKKGLKEMEQKIRKNHRYEPAVNTAKVLIKDLMVAKSEFLLNVDSNNLEPSKYLLKERCLQAATAARPVLEKHREWAKYIAAFILAVITFPVSIPLLALGVFSLKTKSAQKLDQFKEQVEKLATPINEKIDIPVKGEVEVADSKPEDQLSVGAKK